VKPLEWLALFFAAGGSVCGIWFVYYGITAGILRRRILADYSGRMETDRRAVVRGCVYCVVGLLLAGPSLFALGELLDKAFR
jgi:hypothetical protein